jgi:hypothetical protein
MHRKFFSFLILLIVYSAYSQRFIPHKNQVKLGFSSIVKGDFLFGYERLLTKKISAELDLGVLTRDYSEDFFYEISTSEEKISLPGLSLATGIRYYPIFPLDLFFVSAEMKYRYYRYSSSELINEESIENEQRITPRLGVGYILHLDEHFNFDMSGLMGFTFKRNSIDQQNNLNAPSPNKFHFGLNIKFSYSF